MFDILVIITYILKFVEGVLFLRHDLINLHSFRDSTKANSSETHCELKRRETIRA